MPAYLNTFRDGLITLVGATWTDVVTNGIWRSEELALTDFDQRASLLPLCVLDTDATPSPSYGLVNRVDAVRASIYYVASDTTTYDGLTTKLEALRTALWPNSASNPLSSGQVVEYPAVKSGVSLPSPVNGYFLMRGWQYRAGVVIAQCVVGESP